jgi:hypothetical protein
MLAHPTHPFARIDTLRHHALARPLMAALLLVVGGLLLYSVAALVDRRDAAATFVPGSGIGLLGSGGVQALTLPLATERQPAREPTPRPSATDSIVAPVLAAEVADDLEVMLAGTLEQVAPAAGMPRPPLDAAAPPLRVEIMGLADTAWTSVATTNR